MTSNEEQPLQGRAWEEAFLACVEEQARRRREDGEGSRPGHRTRLAGLVNPRLERDGDRVTFKADFYPPVQAGGGPEVGSVSVPITQDGWRTPPRGGVAGHPPEVAARLLFQDLEIPDE